MPVPDEWLNELSKQESLEAIYVNTYTRKDFETAVKGLQLFDKKHGYGVFENPKWVEILEEYSNQFDSVEVPTTPEYQESSSDVSTEATNQPAVADVSKMNRDQLKAYINLKEYDIRVVKSMSDESIRQAILLCQAEEQQQEEEEQELPTPTLDPSLIHNQPARPPADYDDDLPF
ncbi:MAG: hypothetical protein JHC54_10505 [Acinetobacter sp.]|nr:hypothetical protein [Acinetobacter sp.]